MSKIKILLVSFVFGFIGSVAADHLDEHTIAKRILPSGSVYVVGDDVPVAVAPVEVSSGPRTAQDIYEGKCAGCHATDAIGAPVFGNAASWAPRIAKGEQTLITNALNGFNNMPPKGTCGDCSDEEIGQTVKYMIANSQ